MSKPFIIIRVGDALPPRIIEPDEFRRWVHEDMGGPDIEVEAVDPREGESLPDAANVAGVLVTGSAAEVADREDWSEALGAWLQDAVHAGTPVLGICFGHQLLAEALGGHLAYHPGGLEVGTVAVQRLPAAVGDPLFDAMPVAFPAQQAHRQSVRRLPPGAVALARSANEPVQAFRVGNCAWGVQFHPEFNGQTMRDYLARNAATLRGQGMDVERLRRAAADSPAAHGLLGRFVTVAHACRAEG